MGKLELGQTDVGPPSVQASPLLVAHNHESVCIIHKGKKRWWWLLVTACVSWAGQAWEGGLLYVYSHTGHTARRPRQDVVDMNEEEKREKGFPVFSPGIVSG